MSLSEQFRTRTVEIADEIDTETATGMALVAPAVVLIAVTLLYPFLNAVQLSFTDVAAGEFVGLAHYEWVLTIAEFWTILSHTLVWTVANLLLQGVVGVGIALLLFDRFLGRDAVRTVMLIPFVIPTAVTAILWRWLLNSSYGPINVWFSDLGPIGTSFTPLTDPSMALATVTLINAWRWAPLVGLIVFAVLQTIPAEEYEAARIEGAGALNRFYHVTYPHLKGALSVLGLLGFLITFNIFDIIWLLTTGGPGNASTTLPVFIYEVAFKRQSIGQGTALSVVLFAMLLVVVVLFFRRNELQGGNA